MLKKILKRIDKDMDDLIDAMDKNERFNRIDSIVSFHITVAVLFIVMCVQWFMYFGSKTLSCTVTNKYKEIEMVLPKLFPEDL